MKRFAAPHSRFASTFLLFGGDSFIINLLLFVLVMRCIGLVIILLFSTKEKTKFSEEGKKKGAHTIVSMLEFQDAMDDISAILAPRENLLQVFFHLLWQKSGASRTQHTLTNVFIPDTVVLSYSRVRQWYFTSKDGSIRKKGRKKLSSTEVVAHLSKRRPSPSGVSTVIICKDPNCEEGTQIIPSSLSNLHRELAEELVTGTLQAFIDPKRESGILHNNIVVANWTPNVFYLEKRTNTISLESDKYSLHDRTTIAETSPFVKVAPLVSTRTTAQLESVCQRIAQHIDIIHDCRVTNLVIHFKLDENDIPWIMYCSTIRVVRDAGKSAISLTVVPPRAPAAEHRTGAPRRSPTMKVLPEAMCQLCRSTFPREGMSTVAQKHVLFPLSVVSFFSTHPPGTVFVEDHSGNVVPPYLQLLHSSMSPTSYELARRDPGWNNIPILLCSGCSMGLESITASIVIDGDGAIRVPEKSLGVMKYAVEGTTKAEASTNPSAINSAANTPKNIDRKSSNKTRLPPMRRGSQKP